MKPDGSLDLQKVLREIYSIIRFGIVGVGATAIHWSIAWVLITLGVHPVLANLIAFSVAFFFSFYGHFHWSFYGKADDKKRAMVKFFVVAFSAFLINNVALLFGLKMQFVSDSRITVVVAAALIPVISFVFSRLWAFRD